MFLQYEEEDDPILRWSWRLVTDYQVVDNVVAWPSYKWMPDGHLSTLRVGQISVEGSDQLLLLVIRTTLLGTGSLSTPTVPVTEPEVPDHCQSCLRVWSLNMELLEECWTTMSTTMVGSGSTLSSSLTWSEASLGLFTPRIITGLRGRDSLDMARLTSPSL